MLSKLSKEWFKIKIVRDFNKINKPQTNPFGLMQNIQQKNKFFNYSPQYLNFLELVKNTWFKSSPIQTKKLGISDLDKMDLEFLEEVSKLDNIEIVNAPTFTYMYVENGNVRSMFCQVGEVRLDTLIHLKENRSNYTFHIYQITENSARWYKREDKSRLKKVRREKLNELKKVELSI